MDKQSNKETRKEQIHVPAEILKAIQNVTGNVLVTTSVSMDNLSPISATIKHQYEDEQKKAEKEKEYEGVLIGTYQAKDSGGKLIGKVFNVYAAPVDYSVKMRVISYVFCATTVSELQEWHGHAGHRAFDHIEIQRDLQNGTYNGGWIIPPAEILCGSNPNKSWHDKWLKGSNDTENSLYGNHNAESLKGSFSVDDEDLYWSSTYDKRKRKVWAVSFKTGAGEWADPNLNYHRCRLVRLVDAQLDSRP